MNPPLLQRLGFVLAGLLASCAATIEAPDFTLKENAMAAVEAQRSLYVVPPEYYSLRYEEHEGVLRSVGAAIRDSLTEHGYEVLPTAKFRRVWERQEAQMDGLFSSRTGTIDQQRVKRCLSLTMAELAKGGSFGGVLIPKIDYETLKLDSPYTNGIWEGVRRPMRYEGGLSVTRWTSVLAMTLRPTLLTTSGELAFEGAGGIDFAQKCQRADGKVALVPTNSGDIDDAVIDESVRLALGPLLERATAGQAGAPEAPAPRVVGSPSFQGASGAPSERPN